MQESGVPLIPEQLTYFRGALHNREMTPTILGANISADVFLEEERL